MGPNDEDDNREGDMHGLSSGRIWRRARTLGLVPTVVLGLAVSLGLATVPAQADDPGSGPTSGPGTDVPGQMGLPVPLAQAGAYVGWGQPGPPNAGLDDVGQWTLPTQLQGVALREVVTAGQPVTLALTADGRVVSWGVSSNFTDKVPAAVASMDVIDLTANSQYAGVVAADGRVLVWGAAYSNRPDPTDVPVDLSQPAAPGAPRPVQLFLSGEQGYAVMSDHTVRAWGDDGDDFGTPAGATDVPEELRATQIVTGGTAEVYALTTDGTVVGWGDADAAQSRKPPAATQTSGNVAAIAGGRGFYYALLTDGSIVSWGYATSSVDRPDMGGKKAVALEGDGGVLALDSDGALHVDADDMPDGVPAALAVSPIAQFSYAGGTGNVAVLVTTMLRAALPTVTGAARVGSTLTGTPGTFSDSPDQVTSQWLVNGSPVGDPVTGSTSSPLSLQGIPAGAKVAYRSTATKTGEDPVTSTSVAVTVAAAPKPPPPTKVASKAKVSKIKAAKKAKKLTVIGKVTASKSPAGKVKVIIKKGKKTIATKTVKVSAKGTFELAVKKFAKLVAKKLHKKGKRAKTAYKGKYTVKIAYAGNAQVKPSKATKKFSIKK